MKFLYYCEKNNEYCVGTANINIDDIIKLALNGRMECSLMELGVPIRKLLPENHNEYGNKLIVCIDLLNEKVNMERWGYSTFKNEYIKEEVEDFRISKAETEKLVAFAEIALKRYNYERSENL